MTILAGESFSFELTEEYEYYIISGNSTPVDLNVSQENLLVTIMTDKYMSSESFNITFYNDRDIVISHGGSSKRKPKDYNRSVGETININMNSKNNETIYLTNDAPTGKDKPNYFIIFGVIGTIIIIVVGAVRYRQQINALYQKIKTR